MSDTGATRARQDVVADVDEIIEHVINANMLSMPYDVYSELFDSVDGLGVKLENLQSENAKLRELVSQMYSDMQGVLDMSTDTVWVDSIGTLRDRMDYHMQDMAELGMPPADYEKRRRELGIEVD